MKRIHDSLRRTFERHRLVFWYDAIGEWGEEFEGFEEPGVTKLRVANNEFGTKVRIVRDPDPAARFLVYLPSSRPADADNWLLDLLLAGYEYKADRVSLALQDAGLAEEFRYLVEEHIGFFQSGKRVQALKESVGKDDQGRELVLKMMAVLAHTEADVDALLLHFLGRALNPDLLDPVEDCFGAGALVGSFWREVERRFGYRNDSPSLQDFAVTLFRGANPLDDQVALHPHAKVFLQRWKDSQGGAAAFRHWSRRLEDELHIEAALNHAGGKIKLGGWDTFEVFEKYALHQLCKNFAANTPSADLRTAMQERRGSFWRVDHRHGYDALEQAVELREGLAAVDLVVESLEAGFARYVGSWWRLDMAYRRCTWHLRQYGQVQVTEKIRQWLEGAYVNNFLLPLADRWGDQVRKLDAWAVPGVTGQRRFFDAYVRPFLSRGQKVFVIISDALRYEAAADWAARLRSTNRYTAEIDVLLGSLPSYTQLGMASLLPGREWTVDAASLTVALDGRSTVGTQNRNEILRTACDGKATAIQAEDFLNLNTKTDGRALMRDHEVIYVFHNRIDKTADALSTEARTFDAVEETFDELEEIIRKVANINGSNMLVTSDHGFLFQQQEIDDADLLPLPIAAEWIDRSRRFALGEAIVPAANVKIFRSTQLGVGGQWEAAFPLSLGRFPRQGAAKRYVHGGLSLQEIVLPVVKVHKARTDDISYVELELIRVPPKITTGKVAITIFQDQPAVGKTLGRTVRVGIFSLDGTALSEIKAHTFDSKEEEARLRETALVLVLSQAADAFNNRDVELRLEETLRNTVQSVPYKRQMLRLQKPFASDFDEF